MDFKIIGEIKNEETFASGSGIRKFPGYAVFMAKAFGENGKVSRISNLRMELRSK